MSRHHLGAEHEARCAIRLCHHSAIDFDEAVDPVSSFRHTICRHISYLLNTDTSIS